jgi:PTH1 family peptidyl-tRNA hydrolase
MVIDRIINEYGFGVGNAKFSSDVATGSIAGASIIALKPKTYMNESGRAVGAACRFFKHPPESVFVFQDEMDLAAGKVRVKQGGGAAGHRGIKSIDSHIGSAYHRIRIGVGHPGDRERVIGHVLKDFSKSDDVWLKPLLEALAQHLPILLSGDHGGYVNRVTLAVNPRKADSKQQQQTSTTENKGGL